jgi:hypothetical protein
MLICSLRFSDPESSMPLRIQLGAKGWVNHNSHHHNLTEWHNCPRINLAMALLKGGTHLAMRLESAVNPRSMSNSPLEELVPWLDVLACAPCEVKPDRPDATMHNLVRAFYATHTLMFTSRSWANMSHTWDASLLDRIAQCDK